MREGGTDSLGLRVETEAKYEAMANQQLRMAEIDLFDLGQPLTALDEFQQVLTRFPGSLQSARAAFGIAYVYDHELRDRERAHAAYEKVAHDYAGTPQAREAQAILDGWAAPGAGGEVRGAILTTLIDNTPLAGGAHLLRVACEDACATHPVAHPGQFVQMLPVPSPHLLRRPMSIHDEGDGWRSFLVKPVGAGDPRAHGSGAGGGARLSPPLRTRVRDRRRTWPPPALARRRRFRHRAAALPGSPARGARQGRATTGSCTAAAPGATSNWRRSRASEARCCPAPTTARAASTAPASISPGSWSRTAGAAASRFAVLSCGPHAMMAALHAALRGRVARLDVSLEEVMACGVGVCMGCVTASVHGYVPVCTAGPVFASDEVFEPDGAVRHV